MQFPCCPSSATLDNRILRHGLRSKIKKHATVLCYKQWLKLCMWGWARWMRPMPRMLLAQKYWRFWRGAAMHWEPQLKKYVFICLIFPNFGGWSIWNSFALLHCNLNPYCKEKESSHVQTRGDDYFQHPMNQEGFNKLAVRLGGMSTIVVSLRVCNRTRTFYVYYSAWNARLRDNSFVFFVTPYNGWHWKPQVIIWIMWRAFIQFLEKEKAIQNWYHLLNGSLCMA